ncbi:MAG: hypothetical protein KGL39_22590 [Patescibacteria group bacterium]|nr:hypothetical protein [Patescibacteria group bacterium]
MKNFSPLRIAIAFCVALLLTCLHVAHSDLPASHALFELIGLAALGTSFSGGFGVQDANQQITVALPNAASTTVNSTNSLDTMCGSTADFLALSEILITAPALNTTVLPDTKTMTYALLASANSNMAGATVVVNSALVQTGAGSAGAAAATERIRLPTNIVAQGGRYIGLQAVSGANTTNAAASSAKLQMLF